MPSEHKTNETIKYKLATAMKECMIYMTVQWVLGYRKCSAEELAHALASAMPEELQTVFHKYGLV